MNFWGWIFSADGQPGFRFAWLTSFERWNRKLGIAGLPWWWWESRWEHIKGLRDGSIGDKLAI